MQVAASIGRLGGDVALAHTVEVLDASLRGRSVSAMMCDLALITPTITGGAAASARPTGTR